MPRSQPAPEHPAPAQGREARIFDRIARFAAADPQRPAVREGAESLTFGQLHHRSSAIASALQERRIASGERIGLLCAPSRQEALGLLGILKTGAICVPLHPHHPQERIRGILEDAQASLLLYDTPHQELALSLAGADLPCHPLSPLLAGAAQNWRPPSLGGEATAVLRYSSGSTGRPKGIVHTHRSTLTLGQAACERNLRADDRALICGNSLAFNRTILQGICSSPWRLLEDGLAELAAWLNHYQPTVLFSTPSNFRLLAQTLGEPIASSSLRRVILTGEPLVQKDLAGFLSILPPDCRLINELGSNETKTYAQCELDRSWADSEAIVPVGRPLPGKTVQVLDDAGRECAIGETGEIVVRMADLPPGYWHRPDLTRAAFQEPSGADGLRSYRTGDRGRWRADGQLVHCGRRDWQCKVRGQKVELMEVEAALCNLGAIQEAAVLPHERDGDVELIAWYSCRPEAGAAGEPGELRRQLARVLPDFMLPRRWVRLERLPRTATGKIARLQLPSAPPPPPPAPRHEAPRTPAEGQLAALWADLLEHDGLDREADFFALGGHSLLAVLCSERMRSLGWHLPVKELYAHPRLADAAARATRVEEGDGDRPTPEPLPLPTLRPEHLALLGRAVPGGMAALQDVYPLTPLQEGFLIQARLQPGEDAHTIRTLLRFPCRSALDSYLAAWQVMVDRHDILRTAFHWDALPEPVQVVLRTATLPVRHLSLPPSEPDAAGFLESLAAQEPGRLRLDRPPLVDMTVVQDRRDGRWLLLRRVHHLVMDQVSSQVLEREIEICRSGRGGTLPPAPAFRPVVARARDSRSRAEHEAFFRRMLADLGAPTLPFGLHPRCGKGLSLRQRRHRLDPALGARLQRLARQRGESLAALCHLAWALVLARIVGRDEVVFGTVLLGRSLPDGNASRIVGPCINTLPIRVGLGGQSVDTACREIQRRLAELIDHEHAPLTLVQAVSPAAVADALFSAVLNYRRHGQPPPRSDAADAPAASRQPGGTPFLDIPLLLSVDDHGADIRLSVRIQRPWSPRRICLWMGTALEQLATHLESDPGRAVLQLDVRSAGEQTRIGRWQEGPGVDLPDLGVHRWFERQVDRSPDAVALIAPERTYRYAELDGQASRLARRLLDLGIGPGTLLAVRLERSAAQIVALLAILKAGGAYLPLDPRWPRQRQRQILDQARCDGQLGPAEDDGALLLELRSADEPHGPSRLLPLEDAGPAGRPSAAPDSGRHLAYVAFTSGSTGVPKGVAIEHRSILRLVHPVNGFRLGPGSRLLQLAPLAFDAATLEIWGPLLNGGTLVLAPPAMPSLAELAALLRGQRITTLWLSAGLFQALVDEEPEALAGVGQVLTGGDVLSPPHARRLLDLFPPGHELINGYGPTEATTFTCCHRLAAGDPVNPRSVPIGRPIAATGLRVLDASGRPCPVGVPGELHIGGAGLARGYLHDPVLSAAAFHGDPCGGDPPERLYRSGDLVSWNPDGTLAFHGRVDQQIKLRGFRIEPGEIEAQLLAHPAVAQAAVVLRRDGDLEPRLIAYWVPRARGAGDRRDSAAAAAELLRPFLSDRLPDFMVPAAFVPLEALPLTPNGKVDRSALPAPDPAGEARERAAPGTESQRRLHALWAEVLGHGAFGLHDSFFLVGGHSLAAARLVAAMEREFGQRLPLSTVFRWPTIAGQERGLAEGAAGAGRREELPELRPTQALPERLEADPELRAYPASSAQVRLWFLHQLQPDLTSYHLPRLWRLRGPLERPALAQALTDLIARHPTLRTSFRLHGQEVRQILHPPPAAALPVEPLADRDVAAVLAAWLEQENRTPFDLGSGLLLRARLLQLAPEEHLLLLNHHHIASDGWSLSVLARDLVALYNARRSGAAPALPPLRIHYHDYAAWERRRLCGPRLQQLLDHWLPQVEGLGPLELPTDRPRPAAPSQRGESLELTIEPSLLAPFERLCRGGGTTLHMGLLALVALVLHRYSRQDEFAIAIPIWGRTHPDLEPLIGFFINTLPIRTRFEPGQSFRELLTQVRETSVAAYEHQELPFEQIVEAVQPERDSRRNPLVQVMVQLNDLPEPCLEGLEALQVEKLPIEERSAKFELSFRWHRSADQGLRGTIVYAVDLFERGRIERLGAHLRTLIASVVQAPDAPAESLTLLPEAERARIESWQQGAALPVPAVRVHELFERQVDASPTAVALVFRQQPLSYAELDRRANRIAHQLIARGVGRGEIVAVCLERSDTLVVALLAVLKAGGATLPLPGHDPAPRIDAILRDARARWILSDGPLDPALRAEGAGGAAHLDLRALEGGASPDQRPAAGGSPADAAAVLPTSGTTATPKGVVVSHRALVDRCCVYPRIWGLDARGRVLAQSDFSVDNALREWLLPLTCGATVVLADEGQRRDPELLSGLIEQAGCTHVAGTPTLLSLLTGGPALRNRVVTAGGERLPPSLAAAILRAGAARLLHSYGATETCLASAFHEVGGSPAEAEELRAGEGHAIPLGRPLPNTCLQVLDPGGQPCPIGIPGELHIGGGGLAWGYLHDPGRTEAAFLADPRGGDPSARLYRSGDLVSWNPDGTLAFHGRLDQRIKLRGFRIEPAEIEAQLLRHPAVAGAVVVLRHDDPAEPRLAAYWEPGDPAAGRGDDGPRAEELRAFLAQRLPAVMVPVRWLRMERLPRTASGKIARHRLPPPGDPADARHSHDPPATAAERCLATIWAELLRVERIGRQDDFFALGGHSLLAVIASERMRSRGWRMPLTTLFQFPTLAAAAAAAGEPRPPTPERQRPAAGPPGDTAGNTGAGPGRPALPWSELEAELRRTPPEEWLRLGAGAGTNLLNQRRIVLHRFATAEELRRALAGADLPVDEWRQEADAHAPGLPEQVSPCRRIEWESRDHRLDHYTAADVGESGGARAGGSRPVVVGLTGNWGLLMAPAAYMAESLQRLGIDLVVVRRRWQGGYLTGGDGQWLKRIGTDIQARLGRERKPLAVLGTSAGGLPALVLAERLGAPRAVAIAAPARPELFGPGGAVRRLRRWHRWGAGPAMLIAHPADHEPDRHSAELIGRLYPGLRLPPTRVELRGYAGCDDHNLVQSLVRQGHPLTEILADWLALG